MRDKIFLFLFLGIFGFGLFFMFETKQEHIKETRQKDILDSIPVWVKVEGRKLMVDYDNDGEYHPYFIRGVAYHPTPIGRHPSDWGWKDWSVGKVNNIFDDEKLLRRDFELLRQMNVNTIRIWKGDDTHAKNGRFPNRLTKKTLDLAQEYGIKVIAGFWINTQMSICDERGNQKFRSQDFMNQGIRDQYKNNFVKYVEKFSKHPAILFWAIGNENNYHIDPLNYDQLEGFYSLMNEMAEASHKAEGKGFHPVAVVNGEIEMIGNIAYGTLDEEMLSVDIWGVNVYRGKSFGSLFQDYAEQSKKPFWIAEYGVDAWVSEEGGFPWTGKVDQDMQAQWVGALWDEIVENKNVTIGGTVMEYSDEWWKPNEWTENGLYNISQEHFGDGPTDTDCDGYPDWYPPAPDTFFHQEWFGLMSINKSSLDGVDIMTPREVYYTLQEAFEREKNDETK